MSGTLNSVNPSNNDGVRCKNLDAGHYVAVMQKYCENRMLFRTLVLFQDDIALCRAHSSGQGKAQSAGNGMPFPRAATPHWPFEWAPFGRADKRSSALLYSLELATASPSVVRLAADRFLARCIGQYHLERVLV